MKNRQSLLARRPGGAIQDSDFKFVETDVPTSGEGDHGAIHRRSSEGLVARAWPEGERTGDKKSVAPFRLGPHADLSAVRTDPGDRPLIRLKARLNAACEP